MRMTTADAVLIAIPATYFITMAILAHFPLGISTAIGVGSLGPVALVAYALFVDPPD